MPKTLIAIGENLVDLCISLAAGGTIGRLAATMDVDYGSETRREVVELLDNLTATERTRLDALVARLAAKLRSDYL